MVSATSGGWTAITAAGITIDPRSGSRHSVRIPAELPRPGAAAEILSMNGVAVGLVKKSEKPWNYFQGHESKE